MSVTEKQSATMSALVGVGFAVTNIYTDGIVRMRQISGEVAVFVRQDGTVNHPHTSATMIARVAIRDAGVEIA